MPRRRRVLAGAAALLLAVPVRAGAQAPQVAVAPQPEAPLAAVRVGVPVPDLPEARALARTLQRLARPAAEAQAEAAGARLEMDLTPTEAVYTVVGPARWSDALLRVLRTALAYPEASAERTSSALALAERDLLAELERPQGLVRHRLRLALAGRDTGEPPLVPAGVTPDRLRAFHAETMRPERMRVSAAGGIDADVFADAVRGWEAPSPAWSAPGADSMIALRPAPEALFPWVGVAYPAEGVGLAELMVAAALVDDALVRLPLREASAEAWWDAGARALVLLGSAGRGADAAETAQRLRTAAAETAATLSDAAVEAARREVLRRTLLTSRTPEGLAGLVGELLDATADARSLPRLLEALETVDLPRVSDTLILLLSREPAVTEIVP